MNCDIKLVSYSSIITMMHGPIHIRFLNIIQNFVPSQILNVLHFNKKEMEDNCVGSYVQDRNGVKYEDVGSL